MLNKTIAQRRNHEKRCLDFYEQHLQLQREETEAKRDAAKRDAAKREEDLESKRLEVQQGQLDLARQKAVRDGTEGKAEIATKHALVSFLTSLAQKIGK